MMTNDDTIDINWFVFSLQRGEGALAWNKTIQQQKYRFSVQFISCIVASKGVD